MNIIIKRTIVGYYIFLLVIIPFNKPQAMTVPNDPKVEKQDYLGQILAFDAWDKNTGSDEVVVAVIDSGVYIDHPDLKDNIWINSDEIPNDGLDNDNNGFIDDYHGWDFVADSPDPNPKVTSGYSEIGISHGTFVAGIIAAEGDNNLGIAGISWHSKIMPLRVLDSQGNGSFENIIEAVNYAVANGADIINFSLSSTAYVSELAEAIDNAYQQGKIIVAATGNDTLIIEGFDGGYNLDFFPFYPVCHDGDNNNVLGVVSVDENDVKSIFSNYGPSCVDLSAPGENFIGLNYYNPLYPEFRDYYLEGWSGTSMSAPLVSGAAALIKSFKPDLNNSQIYELLINSGDDINLLNPFYISRLGKRLNLTNLLEQAEEAIGILNRKVIVAPAKNYIPTVAIYDLDGSKEDEFYAYDMNFTGGVNIASGNIKSDWSEEIVTAAGASGGPHIRIFNKQGKVISQFFAYQSDFRGGVEVDTLKYENASERKIVVSPQSNYKPLVKIFDYHGNLLKEFLAFEENYQGGLNISTGDVNGDNVEEIIVTKLNGGSLVRIFNQQGNLLSQFEAYEPLVNGLNITVADVDHDNVAEIILAPVANYQSQLKIFDYFGNLKKQFTVFEPDFTGGINLASADIDLDGEVEILTAPNNNHSPEVRVYTAEGNLKINFKVLSNSFFQGIKVSTIN